MIKIKPRLAGFFIYSQFGVNNPVLIIVEASISIYIKFMESIFIDHKEKELKNSKRVRAEDGDRRDWLTFALVDASLESFTPGLVLKRRFLDSDDVKITIDDSIKQAHYDNRQNFGTS